MILTVAINVLPRLFPGTARKAAERVERSLDDRARDADGRPGSPSASGPRVRVFFPWKAMLLASIVLTVVLNLVAR